MTGLAILLGFNFAGYAIHKGLDIPLPGNVIGLMLLTACLFLGWIKVEWLKAEAEFLLRHMMIFFAPTIVGTMAFFPLLGAQWKIIVVDVVVSALPAMLVAGGVAALLSRRRGRSHG